MAKDNEETGEKSAIWKDPRFSHLVNDPRFHQLPKTAREVKIDKRFQSMFKDDKFRVKYTVDKYGRKVNKSSAQDLQKFYKVASSSDEEEENEEIRKEAAAILSEKNDDLEVSDCLSTDIKQKVCESDVDYARGEGRLLTDSSSDEESSEDDDNEIFIEHVWGELDHEAPRTNESTSRLAACNMDWDRIRASDILVLFHSFLPPGGSVLSVKIYPSEFGKQRMAEEDVHGPPELTMQHSTNHSTEENSDEELIKEAESDAEEGDEYHMEKLRQYQLNRLKYYYAVVEFDSAATAEKIYAECDGLEYESTAMKLDLRFIPDDTTFDDEPKDLCTEIPDLSKYQPRLFTTTALQQAKVELTWDETSVERKELSEKLLGGKVKEVSDAELRKFVSYSSEESEEEQESTQNSSNGASTSKNPIHKYKSLLQEISKGESEKAQSKYEMEYVWGVNLYDAKSKKNEIDKKHLTPIEKVLLKKKEKNKRRKEERRKKMLGDTAEDGSDSDDLPSDVDLDDPYFAEEFANGDFEKPKSKRKDKSREVNKGCDDSNKEARELELLLDNSESDLRNHFNLKEIQEAENETKSKQRRKKLKKLRQEVETSKAKVEDDFEVNLNDSRFKAVYTSHMFNIDPTDPHYKKTKGMEAITQEKFKRRQNSQTTDQHQEESPCDGAEEMAAKRLKKNAEHKLLIKNIKKNIRNKQIK